MTEENPNLKTFIEGLKEGEFSKLHLEDQREVLNAMLKTAKEAIKKIQEK